jgi:hypothetical protein
MGAAGTTDRTEADVTNAAGDPGRTPRHPETMEDFRATATAFSQLTGVLGGFSMTILVLVLGLTTENKAARDWTVALLLVASTAYIFAAGLLANCMNVGVLARLSGRVPVFQVQRSVFNNGIRLFHLGNIFLPVGIIVTVYQESLLVGLIASIAVFLLAFIVVIGNFLAPWLAGMTTVESPNDSNQNESEQAQQSAGSGLGWPG